MGNAETGSRPPPLDGGRYEPPGWYADPSGLPVLRWWDGEGWTAHVSATPGSAGGREGSASLTPVGPGAQGPVQPARYSRDGLRRWDGNAWAPVKRWDGHRWIRARKDLRRPLLRAVVLFALAGLAFEVTDRIIAGQISNSCAGLSGTEYEACRDVYYEVSAFFVGPAFLVLMVAAVGYLATHPIVTAPERAGRIVGDAVNIGTMSVGAAEDAWRCWQDQSPTSGRRFIRGYATIAARPLVATRADVGVVGLPQ